MNYPVLALLSVIAAVPFSLHGSWRACIIALLAAITFLALDMWERA